MRFELRHATVYRYAAPVKLGPHKLRLTPRAGTALEHAVEVRPEPTFWQDRIDAHGNRVTHLGFDGETRELSIESRLVVETGAAAPVAFEGPLDLYLQRTTSDPGVEAMAERLKALAGPDPAGFAESLTRTLHEMIDHDIRDTGFARSPGETLMRRAGACRDVAVLFIELCRRAGLPARFVSGYQDRGRDPNARRYLHAWAEVWLPGQGWTGFDATRGDRVGETHVALAAAPNQAGTMPVEGSFFGPGVQARMEFTLDIQTTGAD